MRHEVHVHAMAKLRPGNAAERPPKSAKGGGFAMLRIREGIGAVAEALSHCQIEHVGNLLARRAHAAATTSRHVCRADALKAVP